MKYIRFPHASSRELAAAACCHKGMLQINHKTKCITSFKNKITLPGINPPSLATDLWRQVSPAAGQPARDWFSLSSGGRFLRRLDSLLEICPPFPLAAGFSGGLFSRDTLLLVLQEAPWLTLQLQGLSNTSSITHMLSILLITKHNN